MANTVRFAGRSYDTETGRFGLQAIHLPRTAIRDAQQVVRYERRHLFWSGLFGAAAAARAVDTAYLASKFIGLARPETS